MSILQEYEQIRKEIGEKKYKAIEEYLSLHPGLFLSDVYYKESEWNKFETWYKQGGFRPCAADVCDICRMQKVRLLKYQSKVGNVVNVCEDCENDTIYNPKTDRHYLYSGGIKHFFAGEAVGKPK